MKKIEETRRNEDDRRIKSVGETLLSLAKSRFGGVIAREE